MKLANEFEKSLLRKPLLKKSELEIVKYRHFKGGLYDFIGIAYDSETEQPDTVVYKNARGELWVRPLAMWNEETDRWPDGEVRARFVPASEVEDLYPTKQAKQNYSKIKTSAKISQDRDYLILSEKEALYVLKKDKNNHSSLPNKQTREILLDNGAKLTYNPNHPSASETEPYVIYGYDFENEQPSVGQYANMLSGYNYDEENDDDDDEEDNENDDDDGDYNYNEKSDEESDEESDEGGFNEKSFTERELWQRGFIGDEEDFIETDDEEDFIETDDEEELMKAKDPDMIDAQEINVEEAKTVLKYHNKKTNRNDEIPSENEKVTLWNGVILMGKYDRLYIKSNDVDKRINTYGISQIGTHKGYNFIKWVKEDVTIVVQPHITYSSDYGRGNKKGYELRIINHETDARFYYILDDNITPIDLSNNPPNINFNGDKVSIRYLDQKFSFKLSNLDF